MDPTAGARVFVDADGESILVAYRRLVRTYLVLLFTRGRPWYGTASFDALLDTVPIHAIELKDVDLSMRHSLDDTMRAWNMQLHAALSNST